jgi:hypothetical protein
MERPSTVLAERRCRICGAVLGSDRPVTAGVCSCHGQDDEYRPRHDVRLDERVLCLLLAAAHDGRPLNVCRVLGAEGRDDHDAVGEAVHRLRKQGWPIVGVRGFGYLLR